MTDKQRKIFSEVLDLNWEMSQENRDFKKKLDLSKKVNDKLAELKTEMGETEYNRFMENGKKMFAPKNS